MKIDKDIYQLVPDNDMNNEMDSPLANKESSCLHISPPRLRLGLLLLILTFCTLSDCLVRARAEHSSELQQQIADEIIRFHVIANSDSDEDQSLKLLVKDTLVRQISPLIKDADTVEESRMILMKQLEDIKVLAEDVIREQGYEYSVSVSLGEAYFPLKVYGDYTFPPGDYEALRVRIGDARGRNWWCVMFPPLCFVDETYSIVEEESGEKLKTLLSEEEYDTLIHKKTPVKIRFKLWEKLKDLLSASL